MSRVLPRCAARTQLPGAAQRLAAESVGCGCGCLVRTEHRLAEYVARLLSTPDGVPCVSLFAAKGQTDRSGRRSTLLQVEQADCRSHGLTATAKAADEPRPMPIGMRDVATRISNPRFDNAKLPHDEVDDRSGACRSRPSPDVPAVVNAFQSGADRQAHPVDGRSRELPPVTASGIGKRYRVRGRKPPHARRAGSPCRRRSPRSARIGEIMRLIRRQPSDSSLDRLPGLDVATFVSVDSTTSLRIRDLAGTFGSRRNAACMKPHVTVLDAGRDTSALHCSEILRQSNVAAISSPSSVAESPRRDISSPSSRARIGEDSEPPTMPDLSGNTSAAPCEIAVLGNDRPFGQ